MQNVTKYEEKSVIIKTNTFLVAMFTAYIPLNLTFCYNKPMKILRKQISHFV